ncbi:MAG: hypothetical protein LC798_05560 [Chloroflexi bacterium]|nr:hypothetical protein [Chloroflexota bacterium]
MALSERLQFLLTMDASNALREMGRVGNAADKDLGKADDRLSNLGGKAQIAGVGMMAFAAVAGRALYGFAMAAEEANAAKLRLDNSMANSPALAGESADAFVDLATAIQSKTAADGDAIVSGMAVAAQMGLTGDQMREMAPLAVDLAQKTGVGMDAAFKAVAKAVGGSTGQLERMIGPMQAGETAMDALRRSVGGFAEQEGQTFAGSVERMKNQLGDLQEGIGAGVVNAMSSAMGALSSATEAFTSLDAGTQKTVGSFAAFAVGAVAVAGAASFVIGSTMKMANNFGTATTAVKDFIAKAGGIGPAIAKIASPIGIAAVAIGAVIYSMKEAADDARETEARIGSMAEAITEAGSAAGGAADYFDGLLADMPELADVFQAAGVSTEQFGRAMAAGGDTADAMIARLTAAGAASGMTGKEVNELGHYLQLTADEMGTAASNAETLGQVTGDLAEDEAAAAAAADEVAKARDRAAAATEAERRALEELTQAVNDSLGIEMALGEARINNEVALEEYNAVMADATATTRDQELAGYELIDSYLQGGEAARAHAENQANAAGRASSATREGVAAQIGELSALAGTLAPGSPLRARLEAYIVELQTVPRSIYTDIALGPGWSAMSSRLSGLAAQYQEFRRTTGGDFGAPRVSSSLFGPRAGGGDVMAGGIHRVAERGPEVLVDDAGRSYLIPGSEGTVIPNHRLRTSAASSSSVTNNITVNALDVDDAIRKLSAELAWSGAGSA